MWAVLRAHASGCWRGCSSSPVHGSSWSRSPPAGSPASQRIFGGSTGAEVFLEMARRIVTPMDAVERLGGYGSRVSEGPGSRLLDECALTSAELDQVHAVAGRSLREVLDGEPDGDLATGTLRSGGARVVEVTAAQGHDEGGFDVTEAVAGRGGARCRGDPRARAGKDAARRRRRLFCGGWGAARSDGLRGAAWFLELRRAFEPARVIPRRSPILEDDLRKITLVLQEAYDILKDAARRDRYRRAIEMVPRG